MASVLSAAAIGMGFRTGVRFTGMPFDNMGVMTMKMMSITSMTSTIGVTLMSDTGGGALCSFIDYFSNSTGPGRRSRAPKARASFNSLGETEILSFCARALRPFQEVVDQLRAGVTHLDVKGLDSSREQVEHPDGRDGHEQTDSGGHQRFGNSARHRAETGGLLRGNSL